MHVPMTGGTRVFAQSGVDTFCRVGSLLRVARFALYFGNFCRMREIFDGSMAVGASEDSMNAGGVFFGANGNALALAGFHVRLAVTGKAGFILLERLVRFFLAARQQGKRQKREQ